MSEAWKTCLSVIACVIFVFLFGTAWTDADRCSHAENCGGYRATYHKPPGETSQELGHPVDANELVAAYTYWLAVFTGGLFGATTGLWIFTWKLWQTTNRAVSDGEKAIKVANDAVIAANRHADESAKLVTATKENATSQLRAYVSATPTKLTRVCVGGDLTIEMEMRNHGATPAKRVRTRGNVEVININNPPAIDFKTIPAEYRSGTVVFPGQVTYTSKSRGQPLCKLKYDSLLTSDDIRVMVLSIVDYDDIFGCHQTTTTLATIPRESLLEAIEIETGRKSGTSQIKFIYDAQHTHAT